MVQTEGGVPVTEWFPWLAGVTGARVLFVLLVVAAGAVFSRFLVRLLGRPVARRFERQSVAQTVIRGVRVGTIGAALLFGLWAVGVRFTDVLLIGTVLSAVIGIVLAPLIGNFINGVFILADQPFEIGDMIELEEETRGFVDDITIRYTKIFTLDNTFLVVPNGNMRDRDVINYSAEDERTRRTLDMLVTYECDVDAARAIMERAARNCEAVIEGGPDIRIGVARYDASPDCRVHEFGDDGVLLRLRYWVTKPYKLGKVRSDVNARIRDLVADADVEMAYPHRHLVFDDTSGVARVGVDADGPDTGEVAADGFGEDLDSDDVDAVDGGRGSDDPDEETEASAGTGSNRTVGATGSEP